MRPSVFPRWFPSLLNDLQTEKKKLPDFSGSLLMRVLLEGFRTHSIQKEKPKFVPQRTNAYVEQNVNFSTFLDPEGAGESG